MSINRVIISGNLTRDPELRSTASGLPVLGFGVAVDELEFMSSRNKTDGYDANAEFAAIPSSLSPDSTASVYDEDIPF